MQHLVLVKKVARRKILALCVIAAIIVKKKREQKKRRSRKVWMKEWLKNQEQFGAYHQLKKKLNFDTSSYCNFLRMNASTFEELLGKVAPLFTHQDTIMPQTIPAGERLALTLRFIATGKHNYSYYKFYMIILC